MVRGPPSLASCGSRGRGCLRPSLRPNPDSVTWDKSHAETEVAADTVTPADKAETQPRPKEGRRLGGQGGAPPAAWVAGSGTASRPQTARAAACALSLSPARRAPVSHAFCTASHAPTRVPTGAPASHGRTIRSRSRIIPAALPGRLPTKPASIPPRPPRALLPLGQVWPVMAPSGTDAGPRTMGQG